MFHGSVVALVTPMHQDGSLDFERLRQIVEFQITSGTNALVVCGTTGESGTLSPDEQRQLIRHTVEQASNRVPVIAGASAVATDKTIALAQAAMHEGADACLIMSPPYVKPTQDGLFQHFNAIAKAVGIPIMLYNVPGRTVCDLMPETVERLSHVSTIIGIKEATGSVERALDIHYRCGEALDVFSGDDASAMALMLLGAKGVISVTANVAPKLMRALCDAALEREYEEAHRINKKLMLLHQRLFCEANPIPVKWALAKMGLIEEGIRLPLTPLSECYYQGLEEALTQAEIL